MEKPFKYYPEYWVWKRIKRRCNYTKDVNYKFYGAKGIKCLFNNFEEFYNDIGPRPSTKHTVDRIDNTKGYEPGNVKRSTMAEQNCNKSTNAWYSIGGKINIQSHRAKMYGIDKSTFVSRIAQGKIVGKRLNNEEVLLYKSKLNDN